MPAQADALNPQQRQAVERIQGPLLILAGAGSGKTRVITHRIAELLRRGVPESAVLAVTFTNKAAREMSQRARSLCGRRLPELTVCTFHAFGVRVLRQHGARLGYRPNFSIYDESDRLSLLKEAARELGLPLAGVNAIDLSRAAWLISGYKSRTAGRESWGEQAPYLHSLYGEYQHQLKLFNAVDFDDLILLPVELLEAHGEVRRELQRRFRYFMVDEFQDTSRLQYRLIRLLAAESGNLCVVGDDDQSIYSWRGAHYENLLQFEQDFPGATEIRLEQNYRSTGRILLAANGLIGHNRSRKHKRLWTGLPEGEAIRVALPENEEKEGELIARRIRSLALKRRIPLGNFAVLVRTNSLTRALEEAFVREGLLYQVSGGMSFFQRKEVKDVLAYLRVIANPDDDVNFLRVVNTPRRGLGKKTLEAVVEAARARECSLSSALAVLACAGDTPLPENTAAVAQEFLDLLEEMRSEFGRRRGMAAALRELVERVDYWGYLVQENPRSAVARWKFRNVEGLADSLAAYEEDPDNLNPTLIGYLSRISLVSQEEDQDADGPEKVNLLTIHAAKGLEFDTVFVAGLEEGLLPHARSLEERGGDLEEERRLLYVAITRARRELTLTACRSRRRRGQLLEARPSPFLQELPQELLEYEKEEEAVAPEDAGGYFAEMKRRLGEPGGRSLPEPGGGRPPEPGRGRGAGPGPERLAETGRERPQAPPSRR